MRRIAAGGESLPEQDMDGLRVELCIEKVSSSSMWAGNVGSMDEDHIPRQTKGSGEKAEY